tara:strand:+ start:4802 stop:5161 length:360 start_codon:yes stop_codon:yes gene_type:complete
METKEELIKNVREWVDLDNEMKEISKELKIRRDKKKEISKLLVETMKTNDVEVFDLKDGQLIYKKSKSKKPLNKETLLKLMSEYFQGNDNGRSNDITNFILNNREETERESIARKIFKS